MTLFAEKQVSISVDNEAGFDEECEEVTSRPVWRFSDPGLRLVGAENEMVKKSFMCQLGGLKMRTNVVDVYRCGDVDMYKARRDAFRVYAKAVARKRGGDPNMKYGWYSGSKEQIGIIVAHGFDSPVKGGVCLSALAIDAVTGAEEDERGMRHILMCRLILGNQEEIRDGSNQCYPTSKEFDTGVDCLSEQMKYIVWNAYSNVYILPIYVVSFKIEPPPQGFSGMKGIVSGRMRPTSAFVKFSNLVNWLGRILPPSQMAHIHKYYMDFSEKRIGRQEMITKLRLIAGDKLLAAAIKNFREKH